MVPGYLVIVHTDGTVTEIEGPGGEIWELLIGGAPIADIVTELSARYQTSADIIGADIDHLIQFLRKRDLIIEQEA